mgnify:CR=1 FL=1
MESKKSNIQVAITQKFQRNLKKLVKKYRGIREDVQRVIEQLEAGELPGDRIPGIEYAIYKVRVRNSDAQKGKSGGYRLIYYVKTLENLILLTIYSKSQQEDIQAEDIYQIVIAYDDANRDRPNL